MTFRFCQPTKIFQALCLATWYLIGSASSVWADSAAVNAPAMPIGGQYFSQAAADTTEPASGARNPRQAWSSSVVPAPLPGTAPGPLPKKVDSDPWRSGAPAAIIPVNPVAAARASVGTEQARLLSAVLQNMNPVGWIPSKLQIYSANSKAVSEFDLKKETGAQTPSGIEVGGQQKTKTVLTADLPLERLSSEMDSQNLEILKEFGCTNVYACNLQRGLRRVLVRVFQFGNSAGAYGAYALLHRGASTVVQRGDGSSEDDQSISFWQGRMFVSIYGTSSDDEESKNLIRTTADTIAAILREHAQIPEIVQHLPQLDRIKGTERIALGLQSAHRFFPAPYVNVLDFSQSKGAGIADYAMQEPPDRLKVMRIEYFTTTAAYLAYSRYTSSFSEHALEEAAPFGGSCSLYKMNKNFLLCQLRGTELIIINGARKRESSMSLVRYMY